jgi:hypothetical protein
MLYVLSEILAKEKCENKLNLLSLAASETTDTIVNKMGKQYGQIKPT